MRYLFVVLGVALCPLTSAAQVSIGIGVPNVRIGINLPVYPQLVRVPGYPVYYAPGVDSNYFFYDGMYWVCQGDNWYASSWYDGPWALVAPGSVPVYILRVPVRYYPHPPAYFHGWRADAPPRWGEHWGASWESQHSGWDKWNHSAAPPPAPLPVYQKQYAGNRYPTAQQQQTLRSQNYRYQPRDATVQEAYKAQSAHGGSPSSQGGKKSELPARGAQQNDGQRANPPTTHATASAHAEPQRAPGHGEVHEGKGGAASPQGNSGQPKGEERGAEHGK